jgi:hypothetical protein
VSPRCRSATSCRRLAPGAARTATAACVGRHQACRPLARHA